MNRRPRVRAESGHLQTLSDAPESFTLLRSGTKALCLLGLGADARAALAAGQTLAGLSSESDIFWVEAPQILAQHNQNIPAHWTALTASPLPDEETGPVFPQLPADTALVLYQPGVRLFPSFWGPLLGRLRALSYAPREKPGRAVILPGNENALLGKELAAAFRTLGAQPLPVADDALTEHLPNLLDARPGLCFCVNGRGLDASGELFHTLTALGIAVHIWCVDNPWHVLSAWRAPWWKAARLWVTDASFIEPLQRAGAEYVRHLPLAASAEYFGSPAPYRGDPLESVVFVGRSAFPQRDAFFAGQRLPEGLLAQAQTKMGTNTPPDFAWWLTRLDVPPWPGYAVRGAGLGAEECSRQWRVRCLSACLAANGGPGLTVFGDDSWLELLPKSTDIRPPVDYYTALPGIYAAARYSLNITSLLLPAGLTQRHFDVWAANGFCLTSFTPGLSLFPKELTAPISFHTPAELPGLLERLERDPTLRRDLKHGWKEEILQRHTYEKRLETVLSSSSGGNHP